MSHHILFVDDEVPIRETLSLYFKMKGFAVTTAESRAESIRLAEMTPFNLVILDIDIGGENGLELLDWFKRKYPAVPVVMFTSFGYDPALLKAALARGANAYLSKSESLDNLGKEVRRLVDGVNPV